MSNFYYIMGKGATGKDTIYKIIKNKTNMNTYILYTTRPIREGEEDGIDYHYVTNEELHKFTIEGKVIESRTYQTTKGPWIYATIDDEQLKQTGDIITIGTLESYRNIKKYYKSKESTKVVPIYISIDQQELRKRAIEREKRQKVPNYEEVERRIKADNIDFSDENLKRCGITEKETFYNYDLDRCVAQILNYIDKNKEVSKNNKKIELDKER